MPTPRPSDLEMQVLAILWEHGPATVRQVQEALPDGKARAYTTVLTVLQVMEKKGLLCHSRRGLSHVFQPQVSRESVVQPLLGDLVRKVFGGRRLAAVQCLLEGDDLDADDLKAAQRLLAQAQRRSREGKG